MTGLRLTAVAGPAQAGDWVLQLDPARSKPRTDVPAIVCVTFSLQRGGG